MEKSTASLPLSDLGQHDPASNNYPAPPVARREPTPTRLHGHTLEDDYRWEQGFTLQAYLSPDSVEARKAFAEKRDAKF